MNKSFQYKVGDEVVFSYLHTPGMPETCKFSYQKGTITKISQAGELGARAMDCSTDTLIYWISTENVMYPKFECEILGLWENLK